MSTTPVYDAAQTRMSRRLDQLPATRIHMTENTERNGVEIRFDSKQTAIAYIPSLKARGWRWSNRNGCWYTKRSSEALAYARSLAGDAAPIEHAPNIDDITSDFERDLRAESYSEREGR